MRFANGSGEDIPPYGIIQIDGVTNIAANREFVDAIKVSDPEYPWMVNGPVEVVDGGYGQASPRFAPQWMAYDSGTGTPAAGDEWGPVAGNWKLSADGTGVRVLEVRSTEGLVFAEVLSGAGGECTCQEVHEIRIDGTATAGTITVAYTVSGTSGSASINYNSTASAAKTALISGHSFFTTSNIDVYDGPFPNAGMYIVFRGSLSSMQIALPAVTSSLTGGGIGKAYRVSAGASY